MSADAHEGVVLERRGRIGLDRLQPRLDAEADERLGLGRDPDRRETRGVGRALDGGHVDMGGQVLAADVAVRIVVDLVADVGPQRAVAPADRVVQLGGRRAVVDEQEHAAARGCRGRSAIHASSAEADLGGLAVDEVDALGRPGGRRGPASSARSRPRRGDRPRPTSTATSPQRPRRADGRDGPAGRRGPRWRGRSRRTAGRRRAWRARSGRRPASASRSPRRPRRGARRPRPARSGSRRARATRAVAARRGWPDGERAGPGPVLADDERRPARPAARQISSMPVASVAPKIGCSSGAVRKSPSRPGRASAGAVVAAVRVVQGELHEPRERHRAVARGSRRGSGRRARRPRRRRSRSVGGSRRSPARRSSITAVSSRRPAEREPQARADQRVTTEQDRDRGVRGRARQRRAATDRRSRSGSSRSEAKRSSADGQRCSSAPSRWASRTRRVDEGGVAEARQVRPRATPVRPDRAGAARGRYAARRWPGGARAHARVPRRGPASARRRPLQPAQRPAATSARRRATSARGVGDDARGRREPRSRRARGRAAVRPPDHGSPSSTRSSGPSMSTPSRQRRRRSATGTPATSSSQRGSALSRGEVGQAGEDVAGAGDGDDVGRVAVVRERAPVGPRRRPRRRLDGRPRSASGTAPEPRTTSPPGAGVIEQAPEPRAERVCRPGGPATTRAPGAPAARNPRSVALRETRPGVEPRPRSSGPASGSRLRVEDRNGHVGRGSASTAG